MSRGLLSVLLSTLTLTLTFSFASRTRINWQSDVVAFQSPRGMITALVIAAPGDTIGRARMNYKDDRAGWTTAGAPLPAILLVDSTGKVITSLGLDSTRLLAGAGITLDWNGDTVTIIGTAVDPEVLDSILQANGIDSANVSANSHRLQGYDSTDYFARMGDSAAAHEGAGGITAEEVGDTANAVRGEIRDTVLEMTGADSIIYDGDDGISISYADDTVKFKGDSTTLAFLGKVNAFTKAYYSAEVAETCLFNSHVHVDLKASNFHFVQLDSVRDTIRLDSARAGGRYWLTVKMPAAGTVPVVVWVPVPLWDSVANVLDFKASAVNVVTLGYSGVLSSFIGAINGPFE